MASIWNRAWDAACLARSLDGYASRFDPEYQLVNATIGPGFKIHSALPPGSAVHETRSSAHYALELMERSGPDDGARATGILRELVACQDADETSPTFGLWGYYHEEPARRMQPPDYNWADFIGALLLLVVHRHATTLSPEVQSLLGGAIRRAAQCSIRRNVSMSYTNIAVKSTFLIVGAAELLGDAALDQAARDRLAKFAQAYDKPVGGCSPWAEFNSPTYAAVSLTNFARMRQYWRDDNNRALAARLERRLWEHLAHHWHAPTRQFTGPMSRCYRTDLRADAAIQALLQKATNGQLDFYATPEELPPTGDVALHSFQCPEDLVPRFVTLEAPTAATPPYRECYGAQKEKVRPLQGTVWKTSAYTLGTVNRLDMWTQRRNLLLRWKTPDDAGPRPAGRYAVLRLLKDGYDFASATLVCVQERGSALGIVTFARDAGDKHINLHVVNDRFLASDLRLSLEIVGLSADITPTAFDPVVGATLALAPEAHLVYGIRAARWGGAKVERGEVRRSGEKNVALDLVFYQGDERAFTWDEVAPAYAVWTLAVHSEPPARAEPFHVREEPGDGLVVRATWATGAASLSVRSRGDIPNRDLLYAAALEQVDDRIVPVGGTGDALGAGR